ncbi:Glyoxylase, beta-lactamase superfamily II [Filimonas lacunae]|uniref:Glyoxylase, beta-lactamase superfamily II n=1 Tax=Filimonas lacunae TaxID=477680 RepID=A0A173MHE5_9BACT|nr:MBL fold metallo-hydrolase [Filimonas lacunae]BAV06851.1 organophosphate pesticide hydrolase [Filimonas lacunae]SIS98866.1 Glyoxylase, beta-lactamase superfamily II [Filimonas lacunae]
MTLQNSISLKGLLTIGAMIGIFLSANAQSTSTASPSQTSTYQMPLGNFEVIAISDGTIALNLHTLLHDATPGELDSLMQQHFPDSIAQTAITAFLVKGNGQQILMDAGCGSFFGASLGKVTTNLLAAGTRPEDINAVLLTHLHADHVGGLVNNGNRVFTNAMLYISQPEADFWLNAANKATANKRAQPFFDGAQAAIAPYQKAGKVKTFQPGAQLFPGISSAPSFGHTPGESFYILESKGQKLMFWGDVIHAGAIQFANPSITIDFDVDLAAAEATRKKAFTDAVKKGYWIAAPHLAFPGIGHVKAVGKRYEWVPVNGGGVVTKVSR